MRHNLVVSYCLSLLILATVFIISTFAGSSVNNVFYSGSLDSSNFTPAFSKNLDDSYLLNLFGNPKIIMMTLSGSGFLLHTKFLYILIKNKKISKASKSKYLVPWGVLFAPYLLLLLFTV